MRWLAELAIWIAGGVLLGVIIHILVVFAVPTVAVADAWSKLARLGEEHAMIDLPAPGDSQAALPGLDPNMRYAVCRFDLSDRPLRIEAAVPEDYWSIALYDRRGVNYYTLNDRSVPGRGVTLWIANRRQLLVMQPETPEEQEDRLIVGARGDQGFVLVQALVATPSRADMVQAALEQTHCSSETYTQQPPQQAR